MSDVSVEELELLSFFGVEPSRLDQAVGWPYNELTYQVNAGGHHVYFRLAPAYKDVSVSITQGGADMYCFRSPSVKDVRYHNDQGVETLELVISEQDSIWLRLRPTLLITQSASAA
jgi:hypothetical protein